MKRREFIAGLSSTVAAWPLVAYAEQTAMPVIGFFGVAAGARRYAAFQSGLNENGYFEGLNVAVEFRDTNQYDRLSEIAAELVHRHVSVLATSGPLYAALAAKAATATIPIVFMIGSDPVAAGLVASLSRPGGNITG